MVTLWKKKARKMGNGSWKMIPRGFERDRAKAKEILQLVGSCDRQKDPFSAELSVQILEEQEQGRVRQKGGRKWGDKNLFLM